MARWWRETVPDRSDDDDSAGGYQPPLPVPCLLRRRGGVRNSAGGESSGGVIAGGALYIPQICTWCRNRNGRALFGGGRGRRVRRAEETGTLRIIATVLLHVSGDDGVGLL